MSLASRVLNGGLIAVHFLPERFAEAIAKTPMTDSVFACTVGQKRGHIHYAFADYITAEMMVGRRLDDNVVVTQMMEKTLSLVKQFVEHSESFIADQLNGWGVEILPASPGAPKKPVSKSRHIQPPQLLIIARVM